MLKVEEADEFCASKRRCGIFTSEGVGLCCVYIVPLEFGCQSRAQWRECGFATCRTLFQMSDRVENGGSQICHGSCFKRRV